MLTSLESLQIYLIRNGKASDDFAAIDGTFIAAKTDQLSKSADYESPVSNNPNKTQHHRDSVHCACVVIVYIRHGQK